MSENPNRWEEMRRTVAWPLVAVLLVLVALSAFVGWKLLRSDPGSEVSMSTSPATYSAAPETPAAPTVRMVCATGIGAGGAATVEEKMVAETAAIEAEVGSCPLLRGTDGTKMRAGWNQTNEAVVFRNEKGFSYYDADTSEIFQGVVGRMIAGSA